MDVLVPGTVRGRRGRRDGLNVLSGGQEIRAGSWFDRKGHDLEMDLEEIVVFWFLAVCGIMDRDRGCDEKL